MPLCPLLERRHSSLRGAFHDFGRPSSRWFPSESHYVVRMADPRRKFIKWLEVVLVFVLGYSLLLVIDGATAGSFFSWFGFGPDDSIDTDAVRDYLLLPYMVLGAVMAGWVFLMIQIVRGPLKEESPWAWTFLVRSLSLWFVLDTGMSLVLGYPMHAVFNLPFAVALGIPLARLRPSR